jgi:hypothetical protein
MIWVAQSVKIALLGLLRNAPRLIFIRFLPIHRNMEHRAALLCVLIMAGCSSKGGSSTGDSANPCERQYVVQVTDDNSPVAFALRAKATPSSLTQDVELDDGHVYLGAFAWEYKRPPSTGDAVTLCSLTASDGSQHYSLRYDYMPYPIQLVR